MTQQSTVVPPGDPLARLAALPAADVVLLDLDGTAAPVDPVAGRDAPLRDSTVAAIQAYLHAGGTVGFLSTRSRGNVEARTRRAEIVAALGLGAEADQRFPIFERSGARVPALLGLAQRRARGVYLTRERLETAIGAVAAQAGLRLAAAPPVPVTDRVLLERNEDMQIWRYQTAQGPMDLYVEKGARPESTYALLTFYGMVRPDRDPRSDVAHDLLDHFPGTRIRPSGRASVIFELVEKADVVELYRAKGQRVLVVENEGHPGAGGYEALRRTDGDQVIGVLVGGKGMWLPPQVLETAVPGPEAVEAVLAMESAKRRRKS